MGDPRPEKRRRDENPMAKEEAQSWGAVIPPRAGTYRWQSYKCFPHTTKRTVRGVS